MDVCLPSATADVPCMRQSQNNVLSNSVLYLIFWNSLFIIMEHVDSCFRGGKEGFQKAANKDNL
jgi:hypothetical protein